MCYTMYTVYCTLCMCVLYHIHCTIYSVHYTLYTVQCTVCRLILLYLWLRSDYTKHSDSQYTPYSERRTMYVIHVYSVRHTPIPTGGVYCGNNYDVYCTAYNVRRRNYSNSMRLLYNVRMWKYCTSYTVGGTVGGHVTRVWSSWLYPIIVPVHSSV